jgi:hypothetical protein
MNKIIRRGNEAEIDNKMIKRVTPKNNLVVQQMRVKNIGNSA